MTHNFLSIFVYSFCSDFGLDKCEAVLQYALRTAELCSIQKDDNIAEEMFRLASNAFQVNF